jgi:hypothetical protein
LEEERDRESAVVNKNSMIGSHSKGDSDYNKSAFSSPDRGGGVPKIKIINSNNDKNEDEDLIYDDDDMFVLPIENYSRITISEYVELMLTRENLLDVERDGLLHAKELDA